MSALASEHFALQAGRGAIVGEQVGRVTIYMGAVSSVLIAFGFLAQLVARLDPFVEAVLPALFVLGEFTFALYRNRIENLMLLRQMQRIRGYYRGLVPQAEQFFDPPEADVQYQAAMATVGLWASPPPASYSPSSGCSTAGQALRARHASTGPVDQGSPHPATGVQPLPGRATRAGEPDRRPPSQRLIAAPWRLT